MKKLNRSHLAQAIEKSARADLDAAYIGGASVCVLQDGEVLYKNIFGNAREDSIYRLASMTKPVTSVAIMICVERGLLKLTDKVADYLPEYGELWVGKVEDGAVVRTKKAETPVTVLQLLTHSSGIGSGEVWNYYAAHIRPEDFRTLDDAVRLYPSMELAFEPFTANLYSPCAAFDVAAKLVEMVTGKDYEDFIQEEIVRPLGMQDMTFLPDEARCARYVPMHNRVDGASVVVPMKSGCVFGTVPMTHYLGGAGLVSTLDDYVKFAEMLQNSGRTPDGKQILRANTVKEMATPQLPASINPTGDIWGLGMRVITGKNVLPTGAFGWSGAYGTHFWVDPANRITAIYMKNSYYGGGSGAPTARQFERDVMSSLEE